MLPILYNAYLAPSILYFLLPDICIASPPLPTGNH